MSEDKNADDSCHKDDDVCLQTKIHSALFAAIKNQNIELVQQMCRVIPDIPKIKDESGNNVLHFSIKNSQNKTKRRDLVKYFLQFDVNVSERDKNRLNALHLALKHHDDYLASILYKHGSSYYTVRMEMM